MMMPRLRLLVVEDNPDEAAYLQSILTQLQYDTVGVAANLPSAMALVDTQHPDLCIVDIYLEGKPDGIAFAKNISSTHPHIPLLFLTGSYDSTTFGLARTANPYSYLLKPYNPVELQYAIELAMDKLNRALTPALDGDNSIFIRRGNTMSRININDIVYIEVEGKYSKILSGTEKFLVQQSLKDLQALLPAGLFLRIHRNFIVNVKKVIKVDVYTNEVILQGGEIISFSKHYMNDLAARFTILR